MAKRLTSVVKSVLAVIPRAANKRSTTNESVSVVSSAATSPSSTPEATTPSRCDSGVDGSPPSTPERGGKRGVRFSDECGKELVTDTHILTSWWQEMVFGVDKCPSCGHEAAADDTDIGFEQESTQADSRCERCGVAYLRDPPGDLYYFVEELSQGIRATVEIPYFFRKRKRTVDLFTFDNGESLFWRDVESQIPYGGYRLHCSSLLDVTDDTGVLEYPRNVTAIEGPSRGPQEEPVGCRGAPRSTPLKRLLSGNAHPRSRENSGASACSEVEPHAIRVGLKWRGRCKTVVRRVTITDVHCSSPELFVKGMLQLRCQNIEMN